MPPSFSFIHAADLHLDSPFKGLGQQVQDSPEIIETLREATFKAFDNLIDLCLDRSVDFLLIAGDVYDGADRSLRAQLQFRNGLRRLDEAGISAYVVHGNHDPLDGWSNALQWPQRVHIFNEQVESKVFSKDGNDVARIHGVSYPTRTIPTEFGREIRRDGDEPFQIGLFHCNAGGNPNHDPYAPRSVDELIETRLNYWALGHVHERSILHPGEPFIGYPGNIQGRHIRETGTRGCYVVDVDESSRLSSEPEFVSLEHVLWHADSIDITDLETIDQLIDAVQDCVDGLSAEVAHPGHVVRLRIIGRGPLHDELTNEQTAEDFKASCRARAASGRPFVWIEKFEFRTRPEVDIDSLRQGQDFLGEVLRMIDRCRQSPEKLNDLRQPLDELFTHSRARKLLESRSDANLKEILDRVEILCVDMLSGKDG